MLLAWIMANMLGTHLSKSKLLRGFIMIAQNPVLCAASSSSGSAQFSPISNPSRSKFGSKIGGIVSSHFFSETPKILFLEQRIHLGFSRVFFFLLRCREKQRKESSRLQTVNRKLTAMNRLLMEENDRLQKQVSQLVYENSYFRQQTQNVRTCFA